MSGYESGVVRPCSPSQGFSYLPVLCVPVDYYGKYFPIYAYVYIFYFTLLGLMGYMSQSIHIVPSRGTICMYVCMYDWATQFLLQ